MIPSATLRVARLAHGEGLPLPEPATPGSAGVDLRAAVEESQTLEPGARVLVPTGLAFEIPPGFEGQVRPRSGWALREGVTLLNSPGTIDSDYRGEVQVLLVNLGRDPVRIERGQRIAQLIVAPIATPRFVEVDRLGPSERGAGGFGSSGR